MTFITITKSILCIVLYCIYFIYSILINNTYRKLSLQVLIINERSKINGTVKIKIKKKVRI